MVLRRTLPTFAGSHLRMCRQEGQTVDQIALLLAALIGAEFVSSRGPALRGASAPLHYRLLPYLYTPLQLGLIVWAMNAAVHGTAATASPTVAIRTMAVVR